MVLKEMQYQIKIRHFCDYESLNFEFVEKMSDL